MQSHPHSKKHKTFTALLAWLSLLSLVSLCGCTQSTVAVRLLTTPCVNYNSPLPVALVFVYDPGLYKTLQKLSAAEWFALRNKIIQDNKNKLTAATWQIIPDQALIDQKITITSVNLQGYILYANYFSPGAHRAAFTPVNRLDILFTDSHFVIKKNGVIAPKPATLFPPKKERKRKKHLCAPRVLPPV